MRSQPADPEQQGQPWALPTAPGGWQGGVPSPAAGLVWGWEWRNSHPESRRVGFDGMGAGEIPQGLMDVGKGGRWTLKHQMRLRVVVQ